MCCAYKYQEDQLFSPGNYQSLGQKMLTPINTFESEAITQERMKRKQWMDDETGVDMPVCVPYSI